MLINNASVQFVMSWIICDCLIGCGGQTDDSRTTDTISVGSGGSTYSVAGTATGAASGGARAAGGTLGIGGTGCYPVISNVDAGPLCGNGILDVAAAEGCDDGNRLPGDGCSANCQVEPSWLCPTVCRPCVATVICGDGLLGPGEVCDDGNRVPGDGCDDRCQIEPGFACPIPGKSCIAVGDCDAGCCGDAIVEFPETCDDGINDGSYGGCTPNCQRAAHCGDGIVNGPEICDDGIDDGSYGGCTPDCRLGPHCGDGIVNGAEECDLGSQNGRADSVCTERCNRYFSPPA